MAPLNRRTTEESASGAQRRKRATQPIPCIYCLKLKAPQQFNRDHVVPELFGKFRHNLVLHRAVCTACNSTLGEETQRPYLFRL